MIKTNKDIPVGSIVISKKGNKYLVLADDAGQRGLFTKSGTWMRFIGDTLTFGPGNPGEVKEIKQFDTLPVLDAVSEGIKMMYTGRAPRATMVTIYTAEPAEVTAAKAALAAMKAEDADRDARRRALEATISRYGF